LASEARARVFKMEYFLISLTFIVAAIGVFWRDPPLKAKITLITVLISSSVASVVKGIADDQDKNFLQTIAITGFTLPNAFYDSIYEELKKVSTGYGYGSEARCHHTTDGLTCFVDPSSTQPHIDLVLNRFEVAQIYANKVRDIENTKFIKAILNQKLDPSQHNEEFKDKLGILGIDTFYDICHRFPDRYDYDDKFGIKIPYHEDGETRDITLSPEEIAKVKPADGIRIFPVFEQIFTDKIKTNVHRDCPVT
jgi:hypothetical protein